MEPLTIGVLLVALVPIVFVRSAAGAWMVQQVKSGRMARRTGIWLIAMVTIGPYVLLSLWILVSDPGYWWLVLVLFGASWFLIALPMIILIHETGDSDPRGRRKPPLP